MKQMIVDFAICCFAIINLQLPSCAITSQVTKLSELSGRTYIAFEVEPIDENYGVDMAYSDYIDFSMHHYGYDRDTAIANIENIYTDSAFFKYEGVDNYDEVVKLWNTAKTHEGVCMKKHLAVEREILPQIAADSEFFITADDMEAEISEIEEILADNAASEGLTLEQYFYEILGVDYLQYDKYVREKSDLNIKLRLLRATIEKMLGYDKLTDDKYIEIGMDRYGLNYSNLLASFDGTISLDMRTPIRTFLVDDYLIEISTPIDSISNE